MPVFETGPFNHSGTSPRVGILPLGTGMLGILSTSSADNVPACVARREIAAVTTVARSYRPPVVEHRLRSPGPAPPTSASLTAFPLGPLISTLSQLARRAHCSRGKSSGRASLGIKKPKLRLTATALPCPPCTEVTPWVPPRCHRHAGSSPGSRPGCAPPRGPTH